MVARKVTLEEVALQVCGELRGPGATKVAGLAELHLAQAEELSFVISQKDVEAAGKTKASAVLITNSLPEITLPMVRVPNVPAAINMVLELFVNHEPPEPGIDPTAKIDPQAVLAKDAAIGPYTVIQARVDVGPGAIIEGGCHISRGCRIGQGSHLLPGVIIGPDCQIGDRVLLAQNVVIGCEGFGYRPKAGQNCKIPHLGAVRIGDDVEIGACCCVDRAKFGFTTIGRGTKIDSLVHIAHNVKVGEDCLIAALTGIAGSVRIGNKVVFGGQVGVRDHVVIGNGVMAGARTAIHCDVPDGAVVLGTPALDRRQTLREQAALRKLPELLNRMKKLEQRLAELDSSADNS